MRANRLGVVPLELEPGSVPRSTSVRGGGARAVERRAAGRPHPSVDFGRSAGHGRIVRLLLVRHADALPEGASRPDEHRPLSPVGRDQVRELAAQLAEVGLEIGAVVSSPLVRAVQTAELLVRWLDWSGSVDVSHTLIPGAVSTASTAAFLGRAAEPLAGAVLVAVGHEPSISHLARTLTGDGSLSSFGKAEARLLEDGAIRWRIQPD